MNWYVLYVKPQSEKKVASALKRIGVEVFCPTITEVRVWSDRKKKLEVPLFKSYVFVHLSESERNSVFEVHGVVRYLFWLGKPAVVRDAEIQTIKSWLADEKLEDFEVQQYTPGDAIKIVSGPLKDKEAVIHEIGPKTMRLVLKDLGVVVVASIRDVSKV